MTAIQKFTEKYGISPLKLVEDAQIEYVGRIKQVGLKSVLESYIQEKKLNIEVNSEFEKNLVESFIEAGERFPENGKISSLEGNTLLSIPSINPSVPKSKGTLEDFKEIVGTDDLRPVMGGVFVSEDGKDLVGTDAHKLVIEKNSEFSEYSDKIIDLKTYLQTKGKKISLIDGKYPNYKFIIPQFSPNEVSDFDTYALYNFAKSTIAVHKLVDQTFFNINLKLPSNGNEQSITTSFNPVIAVDLLAFALAKGWTKFKLEYSDAIKTFLLNFGDGNLGILMPIINREGGEFVLRGSEIMTPEEIMDKYKAPIKASKPTAKKPVTPSAPLSSEPYKKFEGDLADTTYVHRSNIASITLTNGEVLGKNDIIDGFYRVNKKMAEGGSVSDSNKQFVVKVFASPNPQIPLEETVVSGETKSDATYFVVRNLEPDWMKKYGDSYLGFEITTNKMATGGNTGRVKVGVFSEADSRSGADKKAIEKAQQETGLTYIDYKVIKKGGKMFREVYLVPTEEYLNSSKFEHGGSMYADGGNLGKTGIKTYKLRAEGLNDFLAFLQNDMYFKIKSFTIEPTGFPDVVVTFDTSSSLTEIKQKLKELPDSHVMLQTVKPFNEYTGEREEEGEYANGGSMSSGHEIGDTVNFNSVLGGTKTGTIISKMGDEGFRVQIGDGFATIKKSAIV
jgi:hypothetical protein